MTSFATEKQILEQAEQHLQAEDLTQEAFSTLLKGYEKLLKRTRRLIKMSDRSEAEIRRLSDEQSLLNATLSDQNEKLESLSVKLSKYLSPQVYESIFSGKAEVRVGSGSQVPNGLLL
jgi:ABC-type phosphate transport system auxiliary subunit